jgi:hypothetical protein
MAITNVTEFKKYCLRVLGAPVVTVDITDEQMEDRYQEALQKFQTYHYAGTERTYLKIQVTATDMANKFLPLPVWVTGVSRVMSMTDGTGNLSSPFSLQYQLRMNDIWDMGSTNIVYYEQLMQYTTMLDQMLNGKPLFRFNHVMDKLFIDVSWGSKINENDWIVIECHRALDPTEYVKILNESWFKKYTTALFKRQWGSNLKKFQGVQLIGGVALDGQGIYDEAVGEIENLEQELRDVYEEPPMAFYMG